MGSSITNSGPAASRHLLTLDESHSIPCITRSFLAYSGCSERVDAKGKDVMIALEDVTKILAAGPFTHEPGLISTLKFISYALSCKTHRDHSNGTSHFAYYIIAQDSLPSLHRYPGFVEISSAEILSFFKRDYCEQSECLKTRSCVHRDRKTVEDLDPGEAWLVFQALRKLAQLWMDNRTLEGYQHMLGVTRAILQSKTLDREGIEKMRDAKERWDSWHQPSEQERVLAFNSMGVTDYNILNDLGEDFDGEGIDTRPSNGDLTFVGSKPKKRHNDEKATVYDVSAKRPLHPTRRVVSSGDQPVIPRKRPNLMEYSSSSFPKSFQRSTPLYVASATAETSIASPQDSRLPHSRALSDCLPMSRLSKHRQVPWKGQSIDTLENRSADAAENRSWRSKSIPGEFPIHVREDEVEASEEDRLVVGNRADAGRQSDALPPAQPIDRPRVRRHNGSSKKVILESGFQSGDTDDGRSLEPFQIPRNDGMPMVDQEPETDSSESFDYSSSEPLHTPPKESSSRFNLEVKSPSHPSLRFQNYYQESKSARGVAHSTFAVMEKQLKSKWDLGEGRVHALSMKDHPGYIKIGRTTQAIMKRLDQIQRCMVFKLTSANDDDHCPIPNHGRVEKLIHAELRNYRRCFPCAVCKPRHKKQIQGKKSRTVGHSCDGLKAHGEWFEIDQAKALEVLGRWRKWISMGPYSDGSLRPREQSRINYYANNPRRMGTMETVTGNDWRWDEFMIDPGWRYWYSWIRDEFFRERLEASNRSRFDSLCKYWQSNLLFCLGVFLLSALFFVGAETFPWVFSSSLARALSYSLISGVMGVSYAA